MYKHILRKQLGLNNTHFRFLKFFLKKYTEISSTKLAEAEREKENICNKRNSVLEEISKGEKVKQQVNNNSFDSQNNS